MNIDLAQQACRCDPIQAAEPFRRVPRNRARINCSRCESGPRRDEKFRGRKLIELADDAVGRGSGEADGSHQR